MALAMKNKSKKVGGIRRGQMPTKRSINLALLDQKKKHFGLAIPGILVILFAAAVFSKFLVYDRMAEVAEAERVVYELQNRLDEGYEELADFDDLSRLYAHYTYSGFTNEELNRTDRAAVVRLIRDWIIPWAEITNWSLTGNQLTINMSAESLQQINLIVQQLEAQPLVDFCMVNTANTKDSARKNTTSENSTVKALVIAYLTPETEVNAG